jgi:hypothetical protein
MVTSQFVVTGRVISIRETSLYCGCSQSSVMIRSVSSAALLIVWGMVLIYEAD